MKAKWPMSLYVAGRIVGQQPWSGSKGRSTRARVDSRLAEWSEQLFSKHPRSAVSPGNFDDKFASVEAAHHCTPDRTDRAYLLALRGRHGGMIDRLAW